MNSLQDQWGRRSRSTVLLLILACLGGCDQAPSKGEHSPIRIEPDDTKRYHVIWENHPPRFLPLDSGKDLDDERLQRGVWLVYLFSLNDVQGHALLRSLPSVYERLPGDCHVAAILWGDWEATLESLGKYQLADAIFSSPLWIVLENGKLKGHTAGYQSVESVVDVVNRALAAKPLKAFEP